MVTSSLAEIQLREMCLFSHLRLESSQPVEKGHIQHFSGRDKIHSRSTWERGKFCSWKYLEMSKIFMRRGDQVTETACDGETEITSDTLMSDRGKKTEIFTSSPDENVWKMGSPCSHFCAEMHQWGQKI